MRPIRAELDGTAAANEHLLLRALDDGEARAVAEHGFHGGAVGYPPVGGIARIVVLDEMQLGITRPIELGRGEERVVGVDGLDLVAARCIDWNTRRSPATCSWIRSRARSGWRR